MNFDNDIFFRNTKIEDAEFLCNLANVEEYRILFGDEESTIEDWSKYIIEWENPINEENYIIESKKLGRPIGRIGLEKTDDKDIAWLRVIILDPLYRGYGYGNSVLNALYNLEQVQSKSRIRLWTADKNKRAHKLYYKHGYKVIDKEIVEVGKAKVKEEWLLMERELISTI